MKEKIKKVIFSLVDKQTFYQYRRRLIKILTLKRDIISRYTIESIGDKQTHTFFGYYDISPFQGDKMLYIKVNKEAIANIFVQDRNSKKVECVGQTVAWNWQQSCRLRWVPNTKNIIMYNSYENDVYATCIKNLETGISDRLPCPLYDISANGKLGVTLDFLRLGVMRPGYGYTNARYQEPLELKDEGISIIDIQTKEIKKIVTYEMIGKMLGQKDDNYKNCYINHLSFSPTGNRILFFWICIGDDKVHYARLLVYDVEEKKLILLEKDLSVSHYDWIDDNRIIVTAYDEKRTCKYYIYNINGGREDFMHDILVGDGHPTWISEDEVITDTYVDKQGYQKILYVKNRKVEMLVDIYSTYKHVGERRCDLHPRYDMETKEICFDADVKGNRKVYLVKEWRQNE